VPGARAELATNPESFPEPYPQIATLGNPPPVRPLEQSKPFPAQLTPCVPRNHHDLVRDLTRPGVYPFSLQHMLHYKR
jgi:hypothetical protein